MVLIVAALFIIPVFALTGFASSNHQKPCSKSGVRANMTLVEKVLLQQEEDKSIRPCTRIKQKTIVQKEIKNGLVVYCKSDNVKKGLSNIELAMLIKNENKDIRPCQFIKMKKDGDNLPAVKDVAMPDGYVYGSVRANLSNFEKTALQREESH